MNSENVIDTLLLARDKLPGSPTSLDALCKTYRVDNSKRTQHTALIDCDLLAKVYINLLDQKEPSLNFKNEENEKIIVSDGRGGTSEANITITINEVNDAPTMNVSGDLSGNEDTIMGLPVQKIKEYIDSLK